MTDQAEAYLLFPMKFLYIMFSYTDLTELITNINRVYITSSSVLWTYICFNHSLTLNYDQLLYLLTHVSKFVTFFIGFSSLNADVADLDFAF